jgi:ABC-type transport system involved in multi-copper enzyme maturation permease subunit
MTPYDKTPNFFDWLFAPPDASSFGSIFTLGFVLLILVVASTLFAYIASALQVGFGEAFYSVSRAIGRGFNEIVQTSPNRVWAIAWFAMMESWRKKVVIVFVLFALLLLFASWFLDPNSENPALLYISFILGTMNLLVVMLAFFLSAFSLPLDIKNRTIYSIVTKPVRMMEIVLGRIVGFSLIGSALLLVMGLCSYLFVTQSLSHTHEVEKESIRLVDGPAGNETSKEIQGTLLLNDVGPTSSKGHRHSFVIPAGSNVGSTTEMFDSDGGKLTSGHEHVVTVTRDDSGGPVDFEVQSTDSLLARVPVFGTLSFLDRTGAPAKFGISVGEESTRRSWVEGDSPAEAQWRFDGINEDKFPDGLPVEFSLGVFRTYKGDIEKGVRGELIVKKPGSSWESKPIPFTSQEFAIQRIVIPRRILARNKLGEGVEEEVDLYEKLVDKGQIQVCISCSDRSQYFGAAVTDLYILKSNGNFAWNLVKGYLAIWMLMVTVTAFGVMFSTILSTPVALLATASALILGFFSPFIKLIFTDMLLPQPDREWGGGPIESFIRLITSKNLSAELELPGPVQTVIENIDRLGMFIISQLTHVVPEVRRFPTSEIIALGFNVDGHMMLIQASMTLAFVTCLSIMSYFILRSRELG